MSEKVFIDTNILAYANDASDAAKQRLAQACLAAPDVDRVISTQVLQEFYVTCTRKLDIAPADAKRLLRSLRRIETVLIDPDLILEAADCSAMDQLAFWDALILVSAEKAHCRELWTEDLNDGQTIRGIRIRNPLRGNG
jgi:predicted nucleic acid-binding protein